MLGKNRLQHIPNYENYLIITIGASLKYCLFNRL